MEGAAADDAQQRLQSTNAEKPADRKIVAPRRGLETPAPSTATFLAHPRGRTGPEGKADSASISPDESSDPTRRHPSVARRNTRQREAIRKVFRPEQRPLSVSEVMARSREAEPCLNQATVYRNLKMLVADGWLTRIAHPEAGTLYERSGKDHHHHFHCRRCSRVFELPGCPLPEYHGPAGCLTEGHELFVHGLCRECVAATGASGAGSGGPAT